MVTLNPFQDEEAIIITCLQILITHESTKQWNPNR